MVILRGVFEGRFHEVSIFTRSGGTPSVPGCGETSRPLPGRICGTAACTSCDRNVHDPTTLRDVSVLPQIIQTCLKTGAENIYVSD